MVIAPTHWQPISQMSPNDHTHRYKYVSSHKGTFQLYL